MASLSINGAEIAFDDAGTGGPAFVFIHGFACDRTFWRPQFDDLSRDLRCIAIDLRGRGESSAKAPFHTTQQADDVAALIAKLGIGPAILVGHSLGGLTALLVNDRHPEAVLGTVLCDSPMRASGLGAAPFVARLREAGTIEPAGQLVESFWSESTSDAIKAQVRAVMMTCPAEVAAGMLDNDAVFSERSVELVKQADTKPFMCIWAEKPLGDPAWFRDICPFVRQEPVAGTGHFVQLEEPAITSALLRAFLDDVARDPRLAKPS